MSKDLSSIPRTERGKTMAKIRICPDFCIEKEREKS
jgi:hypothetical protein